MSPRIQIPTILLSPLTALSKVFYLDVKSSGDLPFLLCERNINRNTFYDKEEAWTVGGMPHEVRAEAVRASSGSGATSVRKGVWG